MEYEPGYVYQLMDQGGPTDTREPYFREAVEEMMRARTLCAKANAVLPDDPSYVGAVREKAGRCAHPDALYLRFWKPGQIRERCIYQPFRDPLRVRRNRV